MKRVCLIMALGMLSLPALADGDIASGQNKAAACVACHGMEGKVSVPAYPNIAGQQALYLELAMKAYKDGGRSGGQAEVMKAYMSMLGEQDIKDLAAYYASLKP